MKIFFVTLHFCSCILQKRPHLTLKTLNLANSQKTTRLFCLNQPIFPGFMVVSCFLFFSAVLGKFLLKDKSVEFHLPLQVLLIVQLTAIYRRSAIEI